MIIPDANLLIYAHNESDPDHRVAKEWWIGLLRGNEEVGIPLAVVMAFVRLTNLSQGARQASRSGGKHQNCRVLV